MTDPDEELQQIDVHQIDVHLHLVSGPNLLLQGGRLRAITSYGSVGISPAPGTLSLASRGGMPTSRRSCSKAAGTRHRPAFRSDNYYTQRFLLIAAAVLFVASFTADFASPAAF
jgi:hypothetical protein